MAITKEDLQDFNRFADEKLESGGADSLVALADEWEALRRGLNENRAEIDVSTLAAAFPEEEDKDKLRQALGRRDGITTAQLLSKAAFAAEKASQE